MTHPSRIRRIAKWSGVVVCVVLAVAWPLSLHWHIHFSTPVPWGTGLAGSVGYDGGVNMTISHGGSTKGRFAVADLSLHHMLPANWRWSPNQMSTTSSGQII